MTSSSDRLRSRTTWWLYYLVVAVLGVCAGVALFDWVTG
jgi:hypothetical protein